ncbi:helix-turn-helix domain-containing protein [Quatrionicoccus australiensis]|uniref:helix-turn-helix domain-containing protein n=1 Tax=Quatrionicoccus australiensis TaxID=138118 RepID=UPI001CF8022B|nr:hypothetical protein [Quatrionicoccus australiensis]UCV13777.1 hypothetical protein KI612_12510 [Quatrionicoccus australiensis]
MSSIGERLLEERDRLGLSQSDLAVSGLVTMRSQRNYEKGDRFPDAAYLSAIASVGADVRYIVTGQRDGPAPETLSADERELLALFRAAPLAVKAAAIGALQGGSSKAQKSQKQTSISIGTNHGQVVKGGAVFNGPIGVGATINKKS